MITGGKVTLVLLCRGKVISTSPAYAYTGVAFKVDSQVISLTFSPSPSVYHA